MPDTLTFGRNSNAAARADAGVSPTLRPTPWDRLAGLFRRGNQRLATVRELHGLSDKMLRDIGVERDEIEASVDALLAASDKGGASERI